MKTIKQFNDKYSSIGYEMFKDGKFIVINFDGVTLRALLNATVSEAITHVTSGASLKGESLPLKTKAKRKPRSPLWEALQLTVSNDQVSIKKRNTRGFALV